MSRRAIQALIVLLIAVFAVSGFLGLRAVIWREGYQAAAMLQSGVVISLVIGGALAAFYVLTGALLWRAVNLDGLSLQFGSLLGALLYGGYNAITPLSPFSIGVPPLWRALQGGIDGLILGVLIGAVVMLVSGRALRLDRGGLSRYLILYVTVILLAWLILLVETAVHLPDVVGVIVAVPLVLVLRLVVGWLDRRVDSRHRYGYDES